LLLSNSCCLRKILVTLKYKVDLYTQQASLEKMKNETKTLGIIQYLFIKFYL